MADEPVMPADVAGLVARLGAMSPDDRTRACVAVNICVNNDLAKRLFTVLHGAPKAATALEALSAENERLRKDAERYRALRDGSLDDLAVVRGLGVIDYGLNVVLHTYLKEIEGDEMDNAIDAARRALEGGE